VMVIGDNLPYLSALVVLNLEHWKQVAGELGLECGNGAVSSNSIVQQYVLKRIAPLLCDFPGYARIRQVTCLLEPWTIEDGLITPTLKLRRNQVMERFATEIRAMYRNHEVP